jgi:hypothetical protein
VGGGCEIGGIMEDGGMGLEKKEWMRRGDRWVI